MKKIEDRLVLVEATIYDNISVKDGRNEVLNTVREMRDELSALLALLKEAGEAFEEIESLPYYACHDVTRVANEMRKKIQEATATK